MAVLLKLMTTISIASLAHSIYSAYEASTLLSTLNTSTPPSSATTNSAIPHKATTLHLPIDITIQTLISTLLLTICIVFSAAPLRPIRWNEWAGRIEREAWDPSLDGLNTTQPKVNGVPGASSAGSAGAGSSDEAKSGKGSTGNPFRRLEDRIGFWDVRGAQAEFNAFIKDGAGAS